MRSIDLGLKTALIVTPVNVLHNWRQEFLKWRPSEVKPLRVFMLEDVSRYNETFVYCYFCICLFYFILKNNGFLDKSQKLHILPSCGKEVQKLGETKTN